MLIDEFLPIYDVSEHHEIDVRAPIEKVYSAVCSLDLGESAVIRLLFRLRGMPQSSLTLQGLQKIRFAILGEIPEQELLLGLAGRFWTPTGDLQRIDADSFKNFDRTGFAKAVWNLTLTRQTEETIKVATETRVRCLDEKSRRKFRFYWLFIGPFSAWTRREILRIIKNKAERN